MNLEIDEVSKMVLTSAAVDIPIVTQDNLICEELIIDVPLVMEPVQWRECCIYKVPKKLRQVKKEAYTPKLISIGPFHHGEKDLRGEKELRDEENENVPRDMEMLKVRYFMDFCYRTRKCQKEIARIIEENEVKIRHCYAEISKLNSEDFVKMVLVDSTFIIELFLRSQENEKRSQENEKRIQENEPLLKNDAKKEDEKDEEDYILSKPWLAEGIKQDLMLLENQLPFFILKELYDQISYSEKNNEISFLDLACGYFSSSKSKIPAGKEVNHFTDLVRYSYCPSTQYKKGSTITHLYSATKLYGAGVMFRNDEVDIQFKKLQLLEIFPCFNISWFLNCLPCLKCFPCLERMQTLLKVPTLIVDDATEICFRNLMALEQCHYPSESYICNYIVLLDYLINTRDDVELFVENKIIINGLGSNEAVATMVNNLGLEIVENRSHYGEMAKKLNVHYENCYNHNMGTLTSTYFPNLWRGTLTVVGLVVFGFSIWSTIKPFVTHQID
ncbi:UPF0481 protein At3g47200-like isoform X2 [Quercus lobata]|uniref:UPF0481 protein At3g47200-like isoform X2 n=1 Tax=Quercus lobata TaxID=97700 RepID=UPI00124546DD|nr:UPF0481 protein At3g47200-like isoform X2 [Quercus lobata]